ncbi:hypothetical protein, partial [Klebsiella pneumoniae]|uniref:hypothetical protein n=1 Tax=Klebsiella pneumoniae TaxID=573 RepID=UPI0040557C23
GYKKFEPKQSLDKPSDTKLKGAPKLIDKFPPEVEALRTKLALGDFGLTNREFLNSDKFLNTKKEISPKLKSSTSSAMGKELSKNEFQ